MAPRYLYLHKFPVKLQCRIPSGTLLKSLPGLGWLEPTVNLQAGVSVVDPCSLLQMRKGGKHTWEFSTICLYPILTSQKLPDSQRFLEYEINCCPSQRGNLIFRETWKLVTSLQMIQGQGPWKTHPQHQKWLLAPQPLKGRMLWSYSGSTREQSVP